MAGYTRQSTSSIINGANITAPPLNAEFNQLLAAFSGSTGHGHTGGSGDAPKIPLATSVSGYLLPSNGGVGGLNNTTATANPVVGDDGADGYAPGSIWLNTNGQKLFVNLNNSSGAAVWSQIVVNNASNQILPHTDNTVDLGSSSFEFKDLYLDGTAYVDSLNADVASIGTTLGVTGAVTFASTAAITGNTTIGGTLGVTGATTLSDNLTVSGNTIVAGTTTLNGNTTIGNASSDTVTVTAQVASDLVPSSDNARDLGSSSKEWKDLYIDGTANIDSLVADTADINGGSIDGTVIGGAVQTSGQFSSVTSTNLTASGAISFAAATISNLGTVNTANIDGGTIDGVTLGVSSPITNATIDNININGSAITSTNTNGNISITPNGSGEVDISKVDIDSGTIDNTSIGASNASTGLFTTVGTSGLATLASVDVNGGNIDGTVIGNSTPQAITGTTITANTGFVGGVTGNVTGNLTGNVTGNVTGNLTGDITGNITASSGASTFNNVTVNGTLDVTGTTIANVTDPSSAQDAATKNYVDTADALKANINSPSLTGTPLAPTAAASTNTTQIATTAFVSTAVSNLVDSAPGTLDTLNELAAALGDDPDFATTITDSIATKLPLAGGTMTGNITLAGAPSANLHPATKAYTDTADALKLNLSGGTMSGAIAMGTSKITGVGDPTSNQDAATKVYTDTQRDTRLALSGGTMSGAIAMGTNKITGTGDPTSAQDVATKNYIDTLFGSTTSAAGSASAAATSATASANSATASASSATASANSATAAAASYDQFDDRYLGAKSSAPTVDNDGDALVVGALFFDTTANSMKVYSSGGWVAAGSSVNGTSQRYDYVVGTNSGSYTDSSTTTFPATYDAGYVDVYLNGVKLVVGTDVTATSGTNVVLASAAATGDNICIVGYGTFQLANFSVGEANDVDLTGNANNAILAFDTTDSRFEPTLTPTLTSLTTTGNVSVGGNLDVTGSFDMSDANITNIGSIALDTITDDGGTITLDSSGDINLDAGGGNVVFKNSGSTFGSIGTANSGDLYIGNDDTTLLFAGGSDAILPRGTAGAARDGAISLGLSSHRFNNLHISGAANVGSAVFADNGKAVFGAQDDLQIYHDGSNSYIQDSNASSDLLIQSNNIVLEKTDGENMIHCAGDGAVQLYHNGSSKLTTSSTGITVTGQPTFNVTDQSIKVVNSANAAHGLEIYRGSDGAKGASFGWGNGAANLEIKNFRNDGQSTGPYANIDFHTGGTDADSPDYNPTRRMRIQQTGEVGVGVDDPQRAFHVSSGSTNVVSRFESTDGTAAIELKDNGGTVELSTTGGSFAVQPQGGAANLTVDTNGFVTLNKEGSDYGLQLQSSGTRSGFVIAYPNEPTNIDGSALVLASDASFRLGTAGHYHVVMQQNGQTEIYGDDSAKSVSIDGTGFDFRQNRYRMTGSDGSLEVRHGGYNGAGTYTLFTNGSTQTQSSGLVEIWAIYGTPSGSRYTKYKISGDRTVHTVDDNTTGYSGGGNPTLSWVGNELKVANSNGSVYYHVKVTIPDLGIGWSPTWGNLSGIA